MTRPPPGPACLSQPDRIQALGLGPEENCRLASAVRAGPDRDRYPEGSCNIPTEVIPRLRWRSSPEDRQTLGCWTRRHTTAQDLALPSRIVRW